MIKRTKSVPASKLVHATQLEQLMQQFFDEHALRGKARVRARDGERLDAIRADDSYDRAFGDEPLISIIVPTYNRAKLVIERALPSVIQQTYQHWELIIVGDGMSKEQAALLKKAERLDSRIRFHNLKVRGRYPSLQGPRWYVAGIKPMNFGLRLARGAWIAHLDDDDEFIENHLKVLLDLAKRTRSEWVHGNVRFLDRDGFEQAVIGGEQPRLGGISRISSIYHAGLKTFRYNLSCWKYFYPGDWDLWERFIEMGVRHAHSLEVTALHHDDGHGDGVLKRDAHVIDISVRQRVGYAEWLAERVIDSSRLNALSKRDGVGHIFDVVITGCSDTGVDAVTTDSLSAQSLSCGDIHVLEAAVPWAEQVNAVSKRSRADWLLIVNNSDVLARDTLVILDERVSSEPAVVMCYLDEDARSDRSSHTPVLKPDINLDLLRSYPYVGRTFAVRCSALLKLGGMRSELGELAGYDLFFRAIERFGLQSIGHIDSVLCHTAIPFSKWLSTYVNADVERRIVSEHLDRLSVAHHIEASDVSGVQRIRYLHERQPPVSIIIPTRDQMPLLNALIDSLLSKTRYKNYELLIVDNDSREPAACAYLDGIEKLDSPQLRVLRYPHPFNYSAINNFAVQQARGEYLVLLNNDTAVLQEDWLEGLLHHAQRPEVGIVGAKLLYPDGRTQHAGVVLGLRGPADHPYIGEPMDAAGYMHRLQVDQNYSAVTAACMMIRKSVYEAVGGLDEHDFKVSYNDVDLCLKVQQAGYLTVWTPYVRLMHEGSVSQKNVDATASAKKQARFQCEQEAMYRKWLPVLAQDRAYNRNLSLRGSGFQIDSLRGEAWQPFSQPVLPRVFCIAADHQGCGHYRIRQPFAAMRHAGLVEGMLSGQHVMPVEMERFNAGAIVVQRQLTDAQIESLRRYRAFSSAFKVYELDDYLPNLPLKSVHRGQLPKDVVKSLRQALSFVDRFVVSTEPLAEALHGFHPDIRVVKNRLPPAWWTGLEAKRHVGRKPRVGWAGGSAHQGDLELITDVVRALADEVEWVFFGMCPEKIRPYVHEHHAGVPIEQYPAMLASMNLDLALAPLEDNLFNRCKSNLRLLEYGACGFPVICSDVLCYQLDDLPVTRVKNRYKDWMAAIRMHLDDLDAAAAQGDSLRDEVARSWMLEGAQLTHWRDTWFGADV